RDRQPRRRGATRQPRARQRRARAPTASYCWPVGAALRAEVSINRRHWRYLAGQRRPFGQAPEARYQLEAIAAPCVHLRSGAVRRTACLAPAASLDNGAASAAGAAP
ncbi:hypothetical protein, partial [Bordetella pertussis]|uniref:hypothetical protein n=1 Tax=Bordetella pertussis TaxID=520 RepID=UPI000A804E45